MKTAIFLHIYYVDLVKEMLQRISEYKLDFNLYVNIVAGPDSKIAYRTIIEKYPFATITTSENKGMDIGGQLVLMDHWLTTSMVEDKIIFLQTKKSPQHIEGGNEWRNELMRIIAPNTDLTFDEGIGMIGSKRWLITDEKQCYHYLQPELNHLCEVCGLFNIQNKNFGFIGGTMFAVKSDIYRNFFTKNPPLNIRELMITTAYAHAMERLLGFIVLDAGYGIKGI